MKFPMFSCFSLRLSVCTSWGCVRPLVRNAALNAQFGQHWEACVSLKVVLRLSFLLHPFPRRREIGLTLHFKTLQSP